MVKLGVRDLGPAPGLSVSVRLRMDAAEGTQVRVLLRIDVDRVRIPCPYVHEPEVRMEEHELRTSLGMDLGAASGGRAGEIAIVPVVTARLVLEPPSAWKTGWSACSSPHIRRRRAARHPPASGRK